MIFRKIRPVLLTALALMFAACAAVSPDVMYKIQDDLRAVKKDVAALKEESGNREVVVQEMEPSGAVQAGSMDVEVRREIASIKADMESLRGEISTFQAFVDETKHMMKQEQLASGERISLYEKRLLEMETKLEKVSAMSAELDRIERELIAIKGSAAAGAAVTGGEREKMLQAEKKSAPESPTRVALKTPEDLYDYALGLIKASKFRDGRKALEEFATTYPKHRLMPNVYYWRGETFYAERDFESAAISLQEVIDRYPDSSKASDALYKQGLCFVNLKDPASAKAAFKLLMAKYPTSISASRAKDRLKEMGDQ